MKNLLITFLLFFSIGWQYYTWPNTEFYSVMNIATGAYIFSWLLAVINE